MIRLYNCYSDYDSIVLIKNKSELKGKVAFDVNNNENFKVVKEADFELTDDIFENYTFICYSKELDVLNDGYRHLYNGLVQDDFSNINVTYVDGEMNEISVTNDKEEIPFYKVYTIQTIKEDLAFILKNAINYFTKEVEKEFKDKVICKLGLNYYYDGEVADIFFRVGTEEDRKNIKENDVYEYCEAAYENGVRLNSLLQNKLDTLIMSVAKDEIADELELIEFLVEELDHYLRSVNWSEKIKITKDFEFFDLARLEE